MHSVTVECTLQQKQHQLSAGLQVELVIE